MEPIRVLRIVSIMNRGGIESQIMNIYRELNKEKVQFDFLITREEEGIFDKEINEMGGKIYRIPSVKKIGFIRFINKINTFFKEHPEYKIIHCHMNTWSGLFLNLAKLNKVPVRIAHSHSSARSLKIVNLKTLKENIIKRIMKYLIKFGATEYWAVSKDAGEWLFGSNVSKEKFRIFPNAKKFEDYKFNMQSRKTIRENMNLGNETTLIGQVGSLTEVKNHSFSLHLMKRLKEDNFNFKFCIVGEGKLRNFIEEKIKDLELEDEIILLGARNDVPRLMDAFDILILPSLFEGIPNVVLESQLSGLQSLVADSVSKEVDLKIDKIKFISTHHLEEWVSTIQSINTLNRSVKQNENITFTYNLENQVLWLENFYHNKILKV